MANERRGRGVRLAAGAAIVVLAAIVMLAAPLVHAADAARGRAKAEACVACHGADGIAAMPAVPHLAGQPEDYLAEQLRQFRSGRRQSEVMAIIAKPLTDDDVADLAAWFASFRLEVKAPQR